MSHGQRIAIDEKDLNTLLQGIDDLHETLLGFCRTHPLSPDLEKLEKKIDKLAQVAAAVETEPLD